MTTEKMRIAIEDAYPSDSWKRKVQDMRDGQVAAVYLRLKKKGVIK